MTRDATWGLRAAQGNPVRRQGASSVADGATAPSRGRGESGGAVQSLRRQGCKQLPPVRGGSMVEVRLWLWNGFVCGWSGWEARSTPCYRLMPACALPGCAQAAEWVAGDHTRAVRSGCGYGRSARSLRSSPPSCQAHQQVLEAWRRLVYGKDRAARPARPGVAPVLHCVGRQRRPSPAPPGAAEATCPGSAARTPPLRPALSH